MKRFVSVILILVITLSLSQFTFAASGDIAGKIYSTDIKASINGVWVDSYNIGGKTVVIVEDITNQFEYYDALRTLVIDDLAPQRLISGKNTNTQKSGNVIGNIYETDIKTYYRGKELTGYSLDGKMAVVVEELGADNTFSQIGGKYIWNENLRTITLETLYRYPYSMRNMLEDNDYNIILTETYTGLDATPTPSPLNAGYILCEKEIPDNSIIPVKYKGEIIGYKCSFADLWVETDENGGYSCKEMQSPVEFFYVDKVEDMIFEAGHIQITAQDWLDYFKNHTISTIKDSFETDEYIFLFMFSSAIMSGRDRLIKINKADGTKIEYQDFPDLCGAERFEKIVIDRENEKVYLPYDKDYVINLKTDEIRVYDKLETDLYVGSADGKPSEYDVESARNTQYEYRLLSIDDNREMLIKGFGTPEFYYANMLPLAETFDFLNIKYSFENDILTIDTSEAKRFYLERTENKIDILGKEPISYLYVDKVILNGEETEITYDYISGHFQNTHHGRAEAKPYVCNGKVYINDSFISLICNNTSI